MENIAITDFQHYWWVIISLLGGILVFLMFVQGGQTLIYTIGKTETERTLIINSIGRKWDLTFTTLVTFGGAFFASFPLFYATSFGGAYWVWVLILLGFIFQAVSYEYRKKQNNFLGTRTFEIFLFINGLLATVLIGAAVSTFFTGSSFSVNDYHLQRWENPAHGLEAALNVQNLLLGLSVFFLTRCLALMYFICMIDYNTIWDRSVKHLKINSVLFLIVFLSFIAMLLLQEGFAVNPFNKVIYMEKYKYLHNFLQMPLVSAIFVLGVVLVLIGLFMNIFQKSRIGIWFSGLGTIFAVFSLFLLAGFNNTSFYPSTFNLQNSLTIENASSSLYTLRSMTYVSFIVPFVIAYIWHAWRAMTKTRINEMEMETEEEKY
jgi:cytochrome bd ubiquinol oxidase subunit II